MDFDKIDCVDEIRVCVIIVLDCCVVGVVLDWFGFLVVLLFVELGCSWFKVDLVIVVFDGIDLVGGVLRDVLENGCWFVVIIGGMGILLCDFILEVIELLLVVCLDGLVE